MLVGLFVSPSIVGREVTGGLVGTSVGLLLVGLDVGALYKLLSPTTTSVSLVVNASILALTEPSKMMLLFSTAPPFTRASPKVPSSTAVDNSVSSCDSTLAVVSLFCSMTFYHAMMMIDDDVVREEERVIR